jgi:hypothetical protein
VNVTQTNATTISVLNALPPHCSSLPDRRTFSEEFRTYQINGRVTLLRLEDDRDHIAAVDPAASSETMIRPSARNSVLPRVYCIDYPLIVKLPQPEVPVARLDPQGPVTYLADVTGISRTLSFRPSTGDVNVASFQSERLLVELIERPPERLHVDGRPHSMCCVCVKSAERLLIAIEHGRDGARLGFERRCSGGTRRRRDRCGRRCRYNGTRFFGPDRGLVCKLSAVRSQRFTERRGLERSWRGRRRIRGGPDRY